MDPKQSTWEVVKKEGKLKRNQTVRMTIAGGSIQYARKSTNGPPKHLDVTTVKGKKNATPSIKWKDEKLQFSINKKKFRANGEDQFKEIKDALVKLIKTLEESGVELDHPPIEEVSQRYDDQEGVKKEQRDEAQLNGTEEKTGGKYEALQETEEEFQRESKHLKPLVIPKCEDVRKSDGNKKSFAPLDIATQGEIQPVEQHHVWEVKQQQKGFWRRSKMIEKKRTLALEFNKIIIHKGKKLKMEIDLMSPVCPDFDDKDCTITVIIDKESWRFSMDKVQYQEIKTAVEMILRHHHTTAADAEIYTQTASCVQSGNELQCVTGEKRNQLAQTTPTVNDKREMTIFLLDDNIKGLENFTFDFLCSSDKDVKSLELFKTSIHTEEHYDHQGKQSLCADDVGEASDIVRKVYQDDAEQMDHRHEIIATRPVGDVAEICCKAVSPEGMLESVTKGTGHLDTADKHKDTRTKSPIKSSLDSKDDVSKTMYNAVEELDTVDEHSNIMTQTTFMPSDSKEKFSDMTAKKEVDIPKDVFPVANGNATVATSVSKMGNKVQTDRGTAKAKRPSLKGVVQEYGRKGLKKLKSIMWKRLKKERYNPDSKTSHIPLQIDQLEEAKLVGSDEDKRTSKMDSVAPTAEKYLLNEEIPARDGRNQAGEVLNRTNGNSLAAESSSSEDEKMRKQKQLPKGKKKKVFSLRKAFKSGLHYGKNLGCVLVGIFWEATGKVVQKLLESFKKEPDSKHDDERTLRNQEVEKDVRSAAQRDKRPTEVAQQSPQIAGIVHTSTALTKILFATTFSSLFTTVCGDNSKIDMGYMNDSLGISMDVAIAIGITAMGATAIVVWLRRRGVRPIVPRADRPQLNYRRNGPGQGQPNHIHIGATIRVEPPNDRFALAVQEVQLPTGANQMMVVSGK
ncbi:uncharacterized protein LOC117330867 [Pecten maximus]|uniref:uncharacterized protein LOC117330867 n=1 Tax=Pecten maximus TaxID=6579 RepID=UPI0014581F1D|nr:uncharacterized protein LOC117330867 [Pecten maximus]